MLGNTSIGLAFVAVGRADLYYESVVDRWSATAGRLLVEQAGGVVSDDVAGDVLAAGSSRTLVESFRRILLTS